MTLKCHLGFGYKKSISHFNQKSVNASYLFTSNPPKLTAIPDR
jgi:hypothetical protein